MREKIKILEYQFDGKVVFFELEGFKFLLARAFFERYNDEDFKRMVEESRSQSKKDAAYKRARKERFEAMTEDERKLKNENDRLFFERWQDEFNASHFDMNDEDYHNNPFRK